MLCTCGHRLWYRVEWITSAAPFADRRRLVVPPEWRREHVCVRLFDKARLITLHGTWICPLCGEKPHDEVEVSHIECAEPREELKDVLWEDHEHVHVARRPENDAADRCPACTWVCSGCGEHVRADQHHGTANVPPTGHLPTQSIYRVKATRLRARCNGTIGWMGQAFDGHGHDCDTFGKVKNPEWGEHQSIRECRCIAHPHPRVHWHPELDTSDVVAAAVEAGAMTPTGKDEANLPAEFILPEPDSEVWRVPAPPARCPACRWPGSAHVCTCDAINAMREAGAAHKVARRVVQALCSGVLPVTVLNEMSESGPGRFENETMRERLSWYTLGPIKAKVTRPDLISVLTHYCFNDVAISNSELRAIRLRLLPEMYGWRISRERGTGRVVVVRREQGGLESRRPKSQDKRPRKTERKRVRGRRFRGRLFMYLGKLIVGITPAGARKMFRVPREAWKNAKRVDLGDVIRAFDGRHPIGFDLKPIKQCQWPTGVCTCIPTPDQQRYGGRTHVLPDGTVIDGVEECWRAVAVASGNDLERAEREQNKTRESEGPSTVMRAILRLEQYVVAGPDEPERRWGLSFKRIPLGGRWTLHRDTITYCEQPSALCRRSEYAQCQCLGWHRRTNVVRRGLTAEHALALSRQLAAESQVRLDQLNAKRADRREGEEDDYLPPLARWDAEPEHMSYYRAGDEADAAVVPAEYVKVDGERILKSLPVPGILPQRVSESGYRACERDLPDNFISLPYTKRDAILSKIVRKIRRSVRASGACRPIEVEARVNYLLRVASRTYRANRSTWRHVTGVTSWREPARVPAASWRRLARKDWLHPINDTWCRLHQPQLTCMLRPERPHVDYWGWARIWARDLMRMGRAA